MFFTNSISFFAKSRIISGIFFLVLFFSTIFQLNAQEIQNLRRVTDRYEQLHIAGSYVLDEHNDTVSLEGMSFFWSQWIGKYYTYDCVKWLRDDWHCDVVRAAMAIEQSGYLYHPEREKKKVITVVEAAIDLGIYVIVDWHSHSAQNETVEAVRFFSDLAKRYGNYPNIIYEIYNEPVGVSWDTIVKPYAETVLAAIRQYDPDNIVIVGTPSWSQDIDAVAQDPLEDKNVAYALHFYAGTHLRSLRNKADSAIGKGLALWVSEFGTCRADGSGPVNYKELNLWFNFMDVHKLSWCNWSVADKKETASVLKPRASARGKWSESKLTESGRLIRDKLRTVNP
jgi:endoglucanase